MRELSALQHDAARDAWPFVNVIVFVSGLPWWLQTTSVCR